MWGGGKRREVRWAVGWGLVSVVSATVAAVGGGVNKTGGAPYITTEADGFLLHSSTIQNSLSEQTNAVAGQPYTVVGVAKSVCLNNPKRLLEQANAVAGTAKHGCRHSQKRLSEQPKAFAETGQCGCRDSLTRLSA